MSEFEQIKRTDALKKYWEGHHNRFIRLWEYTQRGLQMVNEFKYFVILIAAGAAFAQKLIPIKLVILVLAIAVPVGITVLIIVGRWQLRKAQKVSEWISTEYGSVLKYNLYNVQVKTLETLEKILNKIDKGG